MGPMWIWRLILKALRLFHRKPQSSNSGGGAGNGGGGGRNSSVWDIVPDAVDAAIRWLF